MRVVFRIELGLPRPQKERSQKAKSGMELEDFVNWYETLGVDIAASKGEITRSFRRLALKYHPDKHGNDPELSSRYQLIASAYEILADENARKAYDALWTVHVRQRQRLEQLSTKRRLLEKDLLDRERQAQSQSDEARAAKARYAAEVERLRREGRERLHKEEREILREPPAAPVDTPASLESCALRAKWARRSTDWSEDTLRNVFTRFGEVEQISVTRKSALIIFRNPSGPQRAIRVGVPNFTLSLVDGSEIRETDQSHLPTEANPSPEREPKPSMEFEEFLRYEAETMERLKKFTRNE